MPQPTLSDVHVNAPLTAISIAYRQAQTNFVADQVFPRVPVQKQSDLYFEFQRDQFYRSDVEERKPATESAGTGFNLLQSGPYFARVYGLHYDIPDQLRANADSPLDLDMAATELLTQQNLIKRDVIWFANYFGTGIWSGITGTTGTDYAGVTASPNTASYQFLRWDQAGSTPQEDVRTAAIRMENLHGFLPNVLVLTPYVTNALINNPEIKDAVKYTQGGIIGPDDLALLAKFFGVDRVLNAKGVQNSALEGQTRNMSFIGGKHAFLAYAAPNPGLMTPSAGYTFAWTGYQAGADIAVSKWHMQHLKADRVEAEMAFDMHVIGTDLGAFFQNCVS